MQDRHPQHAIGLFTGRGGLLRFAPPLTISLFAVPIVIGFAATLAPAFGYLPAIGGNSFSLEPWRDLWGHPTVVEAATLSAVTGICATLLALVVVIAFCAGWHGSPWFTRFTRLLSPLLAVPHVAVAFGLVFLLAPSGWLVRAVSPWMTGFDRPPDWALAPDPLGISLVIGLAVKEIPFLLLMTLAALNQVRAQDMMKAARALGYGGFYGWMKSVFPSVYRQIRLPVYAVLAYSMSVVDVAAILAPTTPPPLAPLLLRWFNDPDLSLRFTASAGAILQTAMVVAAILVWALGERAVAFFGNLWIDRGSRGAGLYAFVCWRGLSAGLMSISTGAAVLGILGMAVWSVTRRWRFPDFLPSQYTLSTWMRAVDTALPIVWNTVWIGAVSALCALALALACLECERQKGLFSQHRVTPDGRAQLGQRALWLLYLPLVAPQIGFLFGIQMVLVSINADGGGMAVVWSHLLFVLPYVFLSLADPYRSLDPRFARTAVALGASPIRVFCTIIVPILCKPILVAFAVGFAVSIAQYLPTLFAGAGRVTTVTVEAVSLAAGGDRRVIGVFVLLQTILPFLAFGLAMAVPAILFRNRRGLKQ